MTGDKPVLLVADDEPVICELVSASLTYEGFEVVTAADGGQALEAARRDKPQLLILDVMMPVLDGFDVVRKLRGEGNDTPAIFLTARDSPDDMVTGLSLGGDDYVTKPFKLDVLVARVKAILRRTAALPDTGDDHLLRVADISLNVDSHIVTKAGEEVELTPTEFNLLELFMRNAGQVLSKSAILDRVWDYDFGGDSNIVESYVSYLRRKIDTGDPKLIQTVRGVGYRMRVPE